MTSGTLPHYDWRLEAHRVFRRWLSGGYDIQALDVILATVAVERLDGDPVWTLLLSGPGNSKTETVVATRGTGATVTSSISSEGALLSATSSKERTEDATGGLLRKLGPRGVLVLKDFTSILSMNADRRGQVLAALREIYDGSWERNVGTDGGQTLTWTGRIAVIGAVTSAWDRAHNVVSSMGDRFVIVRVDSSQHRLQTGHQAIHNTGDERQMRTELADAVTKVIEHMATSDIVVTDEEADTILAAADLVTLVRTGVQYDFAGNVLDADQPEAPTRFAKQLTQILRGAVAIGVPRGEALQLAIRCARDSMPPMRLAVIDYLAGHPHADRNQIRKALGKPRTTVNRTLDALDQLDALDSQDEEQVWHGQESTRWTYSIREGIDPGALDPRFSVQKYPNPREEAA